MTDRPVETQTFKLYLTRGDSWGVLSSKPAIMHRVMATHRRECYPVPGEMVWLDHLCPEGMKGAFGELPPVGESVLFEINIRRVIVE